MTRKQKPLAAASKKRTPLASKPVKAAPPSKKTGHGRDKERVKAVLAPKKTAHVQASAAPAAKTKTPPTSKPIVIDGKNAATKAAADKKPLGIERRVPEDRQSQLKLLIARGKEQGYLTYSQVNDHLPSE